MERLIAIGDVHGCHEEFEALLHLLNLSAGDRVIQLGDLVNRGPDGQRVVEIAREFQIEAILGNHELRLLTARRERRPDILKDYDYETLEQLTLPDWKFLETLPRFKQEARLDAVFVHGGFLPNTPWHQQSVEIITNIQVIDESGNARKRSECPDAPLWVDFWEGNPQVIYGHRPIARVLKRNGTVGIDTGCVYGGHLTAYDLTEREFIQVAAKHHYLHTKRLPDPIS